MDTEVKTKWLTELRSGKYRQGPHNLRTVGDEEQDNFCCLGVLCEVAVAEGVIGAPEVDRLTGEYRYGARGELSYLPREVKEWAGLKDIHGGMHSDGDMPYCSLTEMNDNEYPFTEIADVIEEKF